MRREDSSLEIIVFKELCLGIKKGRLKTALMDNDTSWTGLKLKGGVGKVDNRSECRTMA